MREFVIAMLALAALGGCADREQVQANLALRCQTTACVCEPDVRPLFTRAEFPEVQWRLNGDAYCPEGYYLRPTGQRSTFRSRYGG